MRIVSLLPAATEICYALGLGEDVVGVSPECDHPPAVQTKPIVSRSLLQYEGKSSGETSRMVGERLESAGALFPGGAQNALFAGAGLLFEQRVFRGCGPPPWGVLETSRKPPRPPRIAFPHPPHLV